MPSSLSPSREAAQAAQWELGRRAVGTDDEDLRAALAAAYAIDVAPLVEALGPLVRPIEHLGIGQVVQFTITPTIYAHYQRARAVLARSQEPQ